MEILCLIAEGLSNQEIAERLVIALGTVKSYVKLIFSKLHVSSRTQAIASARTMGWLEAIPTPSNTQPPRHNLPYQSTPFVGRNAELNAINSQIKEPTCRLLSLIGVGGIGKTRLAIQTASGQLQYFNDGVYFVSLASISSSQFLVSSIGEALGISFYKQEDPKNQLLKALSQRALLLVMDNFEHLLDGANLLSEILAYAPRVKILVTSRERLNLQEEWLFQVEGMQFLTPSEADRLASNHESIEDVDAIQLFARQARRIQPSFSLTQREERDAVIRICQLMEGMPLGIELAATWLRAIPAGQIAERIAHDFDFLATSTRNVPERHRSIRTLFENSWNLLQPEEQQVLMKLSVFRGGFDLEAAQQVAGAFIAVLVRLIDKSLVRPERAGHYDMHELLRQYAYDKLLACDGAKTGHDAHFNYFLKLAQRVQPLLEQSEQGIWLQQLDREHDNFRAALQWAMDSGAIEQGLRLGAALGLFWFIQGYLLEGRSYLTALLSMNQSTNTPITARAEALNTAGMLARYQGDYGQAFTLTNESLQIYRQLEDKQGLANSLANLGFVSLYHNHMEMARSLYEESLSLNRQLLNSQGIADTLSHLALVAFYEGDSAKARVMDEESLALWQQLGDQQGIAWALHRLGNVMLSQGNEAEAHQLFDRSLTLSHDLKFQWGLAWSLEDFARLAALHKYHVLALWLGGAAQALREAIGLPLPKREQADFDHKLDPVRQALGRERSLAVWTEGRLKPLSQLLAAIFEMEEFTDQITSGSPSE